MQPIDEQLDENACWAALLRRDSSVDGKFFYGVMTTGVYCRPGCGARIPKRENVRFYASIADAEHDHLRPCLRCNPQLATTPERERIVSLCRYIKEHAADRLTLVDLAREAKLSPHHLQRSFKAVVGLSPKQYMSHLRVTNFKSILRGNSTAAKEPVTAAIFDAGYGSLSRLYEQVDTQLGMTPMEYRSGGEGVEITYTAAQTSIGLMMLGATDRGLCFLQFGEDETKLRDALMAEYPNANFQPMPEPAPKSFARWMDALSRYLDGQDTDLKLPTHVRATAFQMKVWSYLQGIAPGSVQSYKEVATALGQPKAARAVARACATNKVAIAIPCHRVVRGTGQLGGYKWGLDRKRTLLDGERQSQVGAN